VSIDIAIRYGTEIVSCDSRQVYMELNIGVAKPDAHQLRQVKHHFIGEISIFDEFNAGIFEKMAMERLQDCYSNNNMAILTGGTGLYLDAILFGVDSFPTVSQFDFDYYEKLFKANGIDALKKELELLDKEYFKVVDLNNPVRLIRALSVCRASGKPYSAFRTGGNAKRNFDIIPLILEMNRSELYNKIDSRVEAMMQMGLLDEAKNMLAHRHLKALETVGYKELFSHLDGKCSLDEAIELVKRNSRRYAKRQMTWLRKYHDWPRFNPSQMTDILKYLDANL
jgi:tRNA dimethylallyltransferase